MTPNGTPISTAISKRHAGELAADRDARRDLLDRRLLGDVGEAEVAARQPPIHLPYCSMIGRSRPSSVGDLGLSLASAMPAASTRMSEMSPAPAAA